MSCGADEIFIQDEKFPSWHTFGLKNLKKRKAPSRQNFEERILTKPETLWQVSNASNINNLLRRATKESVVIEAMQDSTILRSYIRAYLG